MMKRFRLALLLAALLLASAGAQAVTITVMDYGDITPEVAALWDELDDAFRAEYPDVTIEREIIPSLQDYIDTLFVRVLGGKAPDIIPGVMRWAPIFFEAGLAVPIDDFIANTPWIDLDDWYPVARDWTLYNGKLYSLPLLNLDVGITIFRHEPFEQAGLVDPYELSRAGEWTWEQLEADAKKLTWVSLIYSNGGEVLNEDFTESRLDRPEAYEAFQWWFDLKHVHGVWGDWNNYLWLGTKGGSAMATGAIYQVQVTHEAGHRVGIAPMPDARPGQKAVHVPFTGGSMILNNGDPERIEAAWNYIAFQLRPDNRWFVERYMQLTGRLPAVRSMLPDWVEFYSEFTDHPEVVLEALASARKEPFNPHWPRIRELIIEGINILWAENTPASQVMGDVSRRINALLQQ